MRFVYFIGFVKFWNDQPLDLMWLFFQTKKAQWLFQAPNELSSRREQRDSFVINQRDMPKLDPVGENPRVLTLESEDVSRDNI